MREARAEATKRSLCPGPRWLKARARSTAEAVAEVGLQGEEVGGHLAGAVGADRAQGPILGDRAARPRAPGRTRRRWPRPRPARRRPRTAAQQHVQGALGVDPEGLDRAGPRPAHVGLPGEVVHDLRADRCEQVGQPRRVEDVEAQVTVGLVDVVARLLQPGDEVAADEAGCAGDQGSHRPESTERRPGHSPPLGGTGPRGRRHGPPTSSDPLDGGLGPPWPPGAPRR